MFKKARWQQSRGWTEFLKHYDEYASTHYGDSKVLDLPSRFGSTRVYLLGNPQNPPVYLFHGNNENALAFADWLVPHLKKDFYVVAIDTMGDRGRSCPKDGLSSNIPMGRDEIVEWFMSVKSEHGMKGKPVSCFGHSHGSFLASLFAISEPDEIDRLVLTGPAGVFAPLALGWAWLPVKLIVDGLIRLAPTYKMKAGIMGKAMEAVFGCSVEEYPYWKVLGPAMYIEQKAEVNAGKPWAWSVDQLKQMNSRNPTILMLGEKETATVPEKAIGNAKAAGIPSKVYPRTGHELWFPENGETIAKDAIDFLHGKKVEGATYP